MLSEVRTENDRKLKCMIEETSESMFAYYRTNRAALENNSSAQSKESIECNLVDMTNAFLLQAGVPIRARTEFSFNELKPWVKGDRFDVGG